MDTPPSAYTQKKKTRTKQDKMIQWTTHSVLLFKCLFSRYQVFPLLHNQTGFDTGLFTGKLEEQVYFRYTTPMREVPGGNGGFSFTPLPKHLFRRTGQTTKRFLIPSPLVAGQ
jgi:hypothetical protein